MRQPRRKSQPKARDLRAAEDLLMDLTGLLIEESAMHEARWRLRGQGVDIETEAGGELLVDEFLAELGRRRRRVVEGFRKRVLCGASHNVVH